MSHVERRTARVRWRAQKARRRVRSNRLALLILAALALLASSCASSDNSNSSQVATDVPAPQTTQAPSAKAIANQSGTLGRYGYDGKELIARQEVGANELLTVKLRYKEPDGDVSKPLNVGVPDSGASFQNASADFKFAAAVAEFGMLLRGSRYRGQSSFDGALELARASAGADLRGYRTEFVGLVETARRL